MSERLNYVYGPVASRRLGSSLGVDLIPRKICDFDCIYCQLGKTTLKTTRRDAYVPAAVILEQLQQRLGEIPKPDYITISGSGEPTLNSELGKIAEGIKRMSRLPLAIITNGSLLANGDVSRACAPADLVIPSLDAADEDTFEKINRPCRELSLSTIVDGLVSFRKKFKGGIWLEVFLVPGINSGEEQLNKLGLLIERIGPDKVQLNTATRPPAEAFVRPLEKIRLEEIASRMVEGAEAVKELRPDKKAASGPSSPHKIIQLLKRRPCTIDDVSQALGINYVQASKELAEMERSGSISSESRDGMIYYSAR
jgi:wyosine [tRNA(Phe)-imidazoG37] synthetase (radical SAM superfamily)